MSNVSPFLLDGKSYNVMVTKLTRKFSVLDRDTTKRTNDGIMYRDIIGTFYNYEMTIRQIPGASKADLDAVWDILSKPITSHDCTFPYNQTIKTQRMYVTGGSQSIERMEPGNNKWGEISLSFVAMEPGEVAV